MSQAELYKIKQEVKERALAKMRYGWFCEYRKTGNAKAVCRKYGISRSMFYYWKKRIAIPTSGTRKGIRVSVAHRLMAYSRKPHTSPKSYPEKLIKLIIRIRKRTGRGPEHIWFLLRSRYAVYVSVTGIYKVLKREGLVRERKGRKKPFLHYEAPKYLPGEKIQIDVKYVKLCDEKAKRLGKAFRWVYQYTAIDLATGIKCKLIYENIGPDSSVDFLGKVRLFYPFLIKIIQTDNGFEFTYRMTPGIQIEHKFTTQCRLYGYEHQMIPPAYPRANSHVERTHRTDKEEVYQRKSFSSLQELNKLNLGSLKKFNEKRPQKSKHFMPPLQFGILKFALTKQKLNYSVLNV
jgi:transposase InsO family protein